ncbi:MAG: FHA domain-containing protein [Myxococcaceae bacterium]|nr:FHA domain-containing protein [Myxococcaceae bacterium]
MGARPSYMLTFLALQAARQGPERFAKQYPGAFLIWEPGSWQPPAGELAQTVKPRGDPSQLPRPSQLDALCFYLGEQLGDVVKVGRSTDNDCIVGDATVGRYHLVLSRRAAGWVVQPEGGRRVLLLGVEVRDSAALVFGDTLQLGGVSLTFGDASLVLTRVTLS